MGLRAAAADDDVAVARDDESLPVLVHAGCGQVVVDQELLDRAEVLLRCAGDADLLLHRCASVTKSGVSSENTVAGFFDTIKNLGSAHMKHVEAIRAALGEADMQDARDGLA